MEHYEYIIVLFLGLIIGLSLGYGISSSEYNSWKDKIIFPKPLVIKTCNQSELYNITIRYVECHEKLFQLSKYILETKGCEINDTQNSRTV